MDHLDQVAKRFTKAMRYIIAEGLTDNMSTFAAALDTYQPQISNIKAGTRHPTVEMLCRICIAFHVRPDYLLLGSGDIFSKKLHKKET